MAKVKISREEIKSLYYYHMDIAQDKRFACKTDHDEKIAKDREKRANRFLKLLKKHYKYEIEKPKED